MPVFRYFDSKKQPIDNPYLALVEVVCISWFTVEYLLRLAGSPHKISFIKQTMNVIDILAIAPYYISLMFEDSNFDLSVLTSDMDTGNMTMVTTALNITTTVQPEVEEDSSSGFGNVSRILQVLRIARVMRIFKLARRSVGK